MMFLKTKRNKVFFKNTLYNYLSTGGGILINLLLIPLLLSVLGQERFGVWQTILSIISLVSLLNFGLGNGLRNLITKLKIQRNHTNNDEIGNAIGSTFIKISKIIFYSALVLLPAVYFFLNPKFLFLDVKIPDIEIRYSIFIFLFFFLLNIVLSLSNSISYGLQKSYLTGLRQFYYLLLCYLIIYVGNYFFDIDLVFTSIVFGVIQSFTYIYFIIYQNKKFKLNINFTSKFDLKETTKLSFEFFIAQALALIFLSIDNFVISSLLGPNETAEFSIVNKVYFTLISLFSVLLIHFWNSVTEAFEKKEIKWIFRTVKVLMLISILTFILGLLIAYFQENILKIWLGKNFIKMESLTFYLFSFYTLFHCLNAIFINIQNGLGILRVQIYTMVLVLVLYGLGCYYIDIQYYGYNVIILLKLVVMGISTFVNSYILLKMKTL